MGKFIVYTAISKGYDTLKPPPALWRDDATFIAFLEDSQSANGWEKQPIYRRFRDPCRNAKIHKILSHRYFPNAEYSLWIDGSIEVKSAIPLNRWADEYLGNHDLAVFKHCMRDCLYEEGAACMQWGFDSSDVINRQMQKYHNEGYPPNNGLAECTVLFRRHTRQIRRFNETWYAEIQAHSRRDQLSFNYVAHRLGVKYNLLPGNVTNNPHFTQIKHALPRLNFRGNSPLK